MRDERSGVRQEGVVAPGDGPLSEETQGANQGDSGESNGFAENADAFSLSRFYRLIR